MYREAIQTGGGQSVLQLTPIEQLMESFIGVDSTRGILPQSDTSRKFNKKKLLYY